MVSITVPIDDTRMINSRCGIGGGILGGSNSGQIIGFSWVSGQVGVISYIYKYTSIYVCITIVSSIGRVHYKYAT